MAHENLLEKLGFAVIDTYTRADMIADGVLVDVTDTQAYKDNGIRFPLALTNAVYSDYVIKREEEEEEEDWRLFDILAMFRHGTQGIGRIRKISDAEFLYTVIIRGYGIALKAVCHGGDNAEPVITIMHPHED